MEQIQVGFVGLGNRGQYLLKHIVLPQGESVTAVCDIDKDRAEKAADHVAEAGLKRPNVYIDYREVIKDENVNTVIIATSVECHVEIAVAAMKAGKAVAMEVGGASSLKECYDLVSACEETGAPFMFLENCCFGRREMMVRNMVQCGLFGEVVHCSGGYHHDMREGICENRLNRWYNYQFRNCDSYPTHALGPMTKVLGINRGNRMLTLSSTASKAAGLREYIQLYKSDKEALQGKTFAQGDIVTTVIKCAKGETIVLTLDTTLPRYYSRGFTVRGSKGMYEEVTDSVFLEGEEDRKRGSHWRRDCIGNAEQYQEEYDHPIWKSFLQKGIDGGHGGMDWLELQLFFEALRNDSPMPVDVYDGACLMAITALSEISIARGGAVVDVPDFTNGKWLFRSND